MPACAVALVLVLFAHRVQRPNFFVGALGWFADHPRSELGLRLRARVHPDETIAVWGWTNSIYIETGLRQAARDAHVERLLVARPLQGYFRERFLRDILVDRPETFVDSIGPCSLYLQDPRFAHDRDFPGLAALVRDRYALVETIDGARIYRRRDLVAP